MAWTLGLAGCGDSTGTTDASAGATQGSTGASVGSATDSPATGSSDGPTTTPTSGNSESNGMTTTDGPTTAGPTSTTVDPSATGTSDPTATGTSAGTTSGVLPDTTSTSVGPDSSSGASSSSSSTGEAPPCEPGDGMGMGMVEKSYIWIASQNTSDVSKVDTKTMTELARYRTGPSGNESPSRTAVSADGRFVVVNNRQTGRSTMIAANAEDCPDKNGNGMLDSSQNKNNLLAFGADECVRWSITLPFLGAWDDGPRGVTWTAGHWDYDQCKYVEPKVWIGYMSNAGGETVHLIRVDGETGVIEQTIPVPGWNGSGFAPYGAALDPAFRPWFSSLRGEFVRVNTDQNPITITRYTPPGNVQSYGFTVDKDGNPWFGGNCGPVTVFDTKTQQYVNVPGLNGCWRGVAADEKYVWVANNSPCGFAQIDRATRTLIKNWNTNPCSTAIGFSIDAEKFVWLVDQGGWAWKFDPENVGGMMKVDVLGQHYVYSDMTGGQLNSVLPQ
ncbi:lyase [Nannocystis sp.]|uniref:lyase n=1 Tax=Nannocystis sp. TaxID=1962667 RepID=UPI00242322B4|nr:lyase [Nannocystis sp.]MBK7825813.1 lyase [Nannocystis sp.]MBK9755648.1 lyase [Nannocystis sp.]